MIKLRFIKDTVWAFNGKLIKAGTRLVVDTELADKWISEGNAVPAHQPADATAEIISLANKSKPRSKNEKQR